METLVKGRREFSGFIGEAYDRKLLLEVCEHFELSCRLHAESICVATRNYDKVRRFWYMSALAGTRAIQLYRKRYPATYINIKEELKNVYHKKIFGLMLRAYASGEDWLLSELLPCAKRENDQYASYRLINGKTILEDSREAAKNTNTLFKILKEYDKKFEEYLRANILSWEDDEIRDAFIAILDEDAKELHKIILKMVRHDRKMYDMYRTMVDYRAYACIRLAKERGILMEPVSAVEVLESRTDFKPVDKELWKIPYQDEVEAWLNK